MSRTTMVLITAGVLALASLAVMAARHYCVGSEARGVATSDIADDPADGWGRRFFRLASLHQLPPAEQRIVEILLLLPVAALIICVIRNVIGLTSFGTFTPALLGLAFRDARNGAVIVVFVGLLLAGWLMRRACHRFHLLQVPRISLMLSLVVTLLIAFIVIAHRLQWPGTGSVALFPMVILTGMIERFWTLEEEDGARASFRTLASTLFIAGLICLVISRSWVASQLMSYPESLGLIMAAQMLLGRYMGFRVTELYRFRELMVEPPEPNREPFAVWNSTPGAGTASFDRQTIQSSYPSNGTWR